MDRDYLALVVKVLRGRGIGFEQGLSDAEVAAVERRYGFRFPPDLKAFLQYALPVSEAPPAYPDHPGARNDPHPFPNWRSDPETKLRSWLAFPLEGLHFDLVWSGFWLESWGRKPTELEAALEVARRAVADAPVLIPIYTHRYLPSVPLLPGNPVLSVMQTDIIYYGYDLAGYFSAEFGVPRPPWTAAEPRPIPFWDQLAQ